MRASAGVDGCRGGWVVVSDGRAWVAPTFRAVIDSLPADAVIGIDMPIGLLDALASGGRECDRAARRELGKPRASSVFSPPPRPALDVTSLPEARSRGCPMTLQTLNILGKIAEVDALIDPALQSRVYEVHPELAFGALGCGSPPAASKRTAAGRSQRSALLEQADVPMPGRPSGAAVDDVLDACAAGWSAARLASGTAHRLPNGAPRFDGRGLRMEICW